MVLSDFQSYTTISAMEEEEEEVALNPEIKQIEYAERYGRFAVEPLEPGYGMTLGNPLRRVLYNSLKRRRRDLGENRRRSP